MSPLEGARPAPAPGPAIAYTSSLPRSSWRRRVRWPMVAVWAGFIFYLSTAGFGPSFTEWLLVQILGLLHITVSPHVFDLLHLALRKLAHLTEYAIFCLLIYAGFLETRDFEWRPRLALRCVVMAGLYSLTDEYHQSFVMSRTPSLVDCGIDTTGAALGALVALAWDRLRHTASSRRAAAKERAAETSKGTAGV